MILSKFSWLFLKMKLLRGTVHRSVIRGRGTGPEAGKPRKYAARRAKSAKNSKFLTLYDRNWRSQAGRPYRVLRFRGLRYSACKLLNLLGKCKLVKAPSELRADEL